MVSRGRSLIGRAGVLMKWPSPIISKFPSRDNFGDDGHVALGTSQGFLNSPKIKYLGGDSVSGKTVHVWKFFLIISFWKSICRIWTLWWFIGLALHSARLDTGPWHWVWTVESPEWKKWDFPPGTFGDVYSFWRLCWGFRELDSNSWYLFLITLACFFA